MGRPDPATEVQRIKLLRLRETEKQNYIVNNWQSEDIENLLNILGVQDDAARLQIGDKLRSWLSNVLLEYGRTRGIRNPNLPTLGNMQFTPAQMIAALEKNLKPASLPYALISELIHDDERSTSLPLDLDAVQDAVIFNNQKEIPLGLATQVTHLMNAHQISFEEAKTQVIQKLKSDKRLGSNKEGILAAQWACALLLSFVAHEVPTISKRRKEKFIRAALVLLKIQNPNPKTSLNKFRKFIKEAERFNQVSPTQPQQEIEETEFAHLKNVQI